MSPHALDKPGTRHTDTQWKAKGGEGSKQKPLKRSTNKAPTSRPTDKQALWPRAQGIPCMLKHTNPTDQLLILWHTNPTDQLTADAPSCLPG